MNAKGHYLLLYSIALETVSHHPKIYYKNIFIA